MTSAQLRLISLTATGAVLFPILGLAAGAMVPLAMSTFGTVVAGVGTFHAPFLAALQASSAALVSGGGAVAGGIAGATVGGLSLKKSR